MRQGIEVAGLYVRDQEEARAFYVDKLGFRVHTDVRNGDYRQRDYATNVLTFDYTQEPIVTADLVLCAPVVEKEAREAGKTLQAHYAHLLVHGTLHAQGWDHETGEEDAEEMEARETEILARLGFDDPYA